MQDRYFLPFCILSIKRSATILILQKMNNQISKDTICALATPAGGAIAVIRLSGKQSIAIADKVFLSSNGRNLYEAKPNTLHYGEIVSNKVAVFDKNNDKCDKSLNDKCEKNIIDDVVVSVYHAPHSYTGEDCVEISCHGSRYIVQQILLLLQANGARQAEPGEYTRRAYLNGKMDLSQAEAVADLIASTNRASHDMAISQLRGHVRTALDALRERLQKLTALLELELDFSDHEDLEFADRTELTNLANEIYEHLTCLAETYRTGKAIKEGIPVAIVGKTNVGKSTLLNRLIGEDRAIVSDIPGTTRDSIEDTIDINGVTFRFIDTAGLRQTDDKVEKIGISRALDKINKAAVILWVIDEIPSDEEIKKINKITDGKKVIIVRNKLDLEDGQNVKSIKFPIPNSNFQFQSISAKNGTNVNLLKKDIYVAANILEINETDVVVSSARQYALLEDALTNLSRVIDGLKAGLSSDLVAEDLRLVIDNLSNITGIERITPSSTLDLIFSTFCIGK